MAARYRLVPPVLNWPARQELRDYECDEPCDSDHSDDDAADGKLAYGEDAVIEAEDGEFQGRSGYRKDNSGGEEQLDVFLVANQGREKVEEG